MKFNFFIDRLRKFFNQEQTSAKPVYLQENRMNTKYRMKKRMFLNDEFDMPAFVIAVVEDTTDLQSDKSEEFHYGEISLVLSDCIRQVSYDFCLYSEESRKNSLNKIKRLAETINEFREVLEKEIEMVNSIKSNKTKTANA
jgi:hypothetical protein